MKKVADLLVKGGVGGCSYEDFVTRDTSVPQPQPFDPVTNPSLALGPPLTARQLLHLARNPEASESNSGNKYSSPASTDDETDNEEDRTIFKLKTKYKELKKTVKRQAEASAQFMKKVADLLVRGGIGGCSSEDFVTRDTSVPQPQPFDPVTNPFWPLDLP
ncbi:hypothetical protein DY000_02029360 [Brassica cretica]|uniref:Uncharacterized protein n=1 Tax=Brassica cretica TaxID=69181 RepID=A0ABQ7E0K7_BRACR|nr:hypothetical protein DY000_02029360 [Brassica cretica]